MVRCMVFATLSSQNAVALAAAVLLLIYLVYAIAKAERF